MTGPITTCPHNDQSRDDRSHNDRSHNALFLQLILLPHVPVRHPGYVKRTLIFSLQLTGSPFHRIFAITLCL